ncbi:g12830 [Coccomyxa viridis]|uniref:G12830 protein n=1 Tax=Coccomyxa viridis TaxID=1274662 RepID=A0ABP1GG03_9CHLO
MVAPGQLRNHSQEEEGQEEARAPPGHFLRVEKLPMADEQCVRPQPLLDASLPEDVEEGGGNDSPTYTIGAALDHIGFGRFHVMLLFYCGCAWAADAVEMMLLSFLGPAVKCLWNITPAQESLITSIVFCGTMIGAYSWGVLGDAKGRRVGFFATAMFTFVFGVLSAASPNYVALVILRGLMGVGLGGAPVAFALYLELVPSKYRGALLVALQSFWTIGSMLEAGLAWGILSDWGWRWLVAISSVPLLLLMLLYPLLPESPYWLLAMGRTQEVHAMLSKIARMNGKELPPGRLQPAAAHKAKDATLGKQRAENGADSSAKAGSGLRRRVLEPLQGLLWALKPLMQRALRRTTLLLMFIWFTNALCYYGLVLLTTSLHAQGGGNSCGAGGKLILAQRDLRDIFIASTAELPGLLVAALVMDPLGRKWSLALSLLGIGISTGLLIVTSRADTVLLFAGRACSMGSFAILYVYTPEVFPTKVRALGLGVNNAMSRVGALLSPFMAVALVERGMPHAAEGIIAGICVLAAIATLCLPLETAGKALLVDAEKSEESASGTADGQHNLLGSRGCSVKQTGRAA